MPNNAFKFSFADKGQAYGEAKAHFLIGASTPRGIPWGSGSETS